MEINSNKTILIITPFFRPNIGGVETHLVDLCNYLQRHNFSVYMIVYQPLTTRLRGESIEKRENLTIRRIRWFGFNLFPMLEPYPILQFFYLTPGIFVQTLLFLMKNAGKIDVIHSHGLSAAVVSGILGKLFRKKTVVSLHTIYRFKDRHLIAPFVRIVLQLNNKTLVLGPQAKDDCVSIGLDSKKIDTYTYWVNQEIFSPKDKIECRRNLGLPEDRFIALFVGRFIKQKGVKLVVEAVKLCDDDILFLFVGEGPDEVFIKEICRTKKNVKLIGKIDNKDMPDYYNASDILAWGNIDTGYLGRNCLEAISCGLPLITPNKGMFFDIPREITTQDLDPAIGVLLEPEPLALARFLNFLKGNPAELKRLAANTIEYAKKHHSEDNAKKIIQAYFT